MNKGLKDNELLLARNFTRLTVFPVLIALLSAFVFSVASAQESQEPKIYLMKDQVYHSDSNKEHWNLEGYWSDNVTPLTVHNSIFVVGNGFHVRTDESKENQIFGGEDHRDNQLYIGYKVDLEHGTVDLNDYGEDVYGVLHLKAKINDKKDSVTVDDLHIGRGEIFQGEPNAAITLLGSLTIEGRGRLRVVSERKESVEDRVFVIGSSIHGTGTLCIVSEEAHGHHKSEIFISSENNDFSGDVYIESGTNIHFDDDQQESYSYDYQTHLFLTGKNALFNAAHILNEGIVDITADQKFRNYDGDDSYGAFTGVGQLIVNEGVTVELVYDNNAYSNEPIGLITVVNKDNKSGHLIFNIADGITKTIKMSENSEDYSKIEGQEPIVKTGDGTLQIVSAAAGLIGAESFVVSSGRLDMEGYFGGSILVGDNTLPDEVIFSPGVPETPDYVNIDGDLILTDSATLLMEIGGKRSELNDQLFLTGKDSELMYTDNTVVRFNPLPGYTPSLYDIIPVKMPEFDWTKAKFSSDAFVLLKYENGIQYLGINPNFVPEPSTWALLALGVAGLLYLRKRNS